MRLSRFRSNFSSVLKKSRDVYFVLVLLVTLLFWSDSTAQTLFNYPFTPVHPEVDTVFGKVVNDVYRWLEDVNSPKVQDWSK